MADKVHWEKIGVYISLLVGFMTVIIYISDLKERVEKLEVEMVYTKEKIKTQEERKEKK